jgi:membrane protease YdiL (CAAX protease family)
MLVVWIHTVTGEEFVNSTNTPSDMQVLKRQIGFFLASTFALSAVFWILIIRAGGLSTAYVIGLMWCPGISAMATRLIFHRTLKGLGWGWGKTRYQIASYLLPLAYAGVVYGLVWFTVLGERQPQFGASLWNFIFIGTAFSLFTALGEEIGWRGYLVPQLFKLTGFTAAALFSGCIWALWHMPLIVFADYNAGAPAWFSVICFATMAVGISFAFAWLRIKSGSLWTAALIHASHNLYIQGYFDQVTVQTETTTYLTGEFGAGLALSSVVVAIVFWRLRNRLPDS